MCCKQGRPEWTNLIPTHAFSLCCQSVEGSFAQFGWKLQTGKNAAELAAPGVKCQQPLTFSVTALLLSGTPIHSSAAQANPWPLSGALPAASAVALVLPGDLRRSLPNSGSGCQWPLPVDTSHLLPYTATSGHQLMPVIARSHCWSLPWISTELCLLLLVSATGLRTLQNVYSSFKYDLLCLYYTG